MRSNLVNLVIAAGFMLGASAAFADNNWAFDDAYWKQPQTVGSVQATAVIPGKYDHVDGYNP
jgi:undecaprenyl pyrophosphate phosphatase UppP